MKGNLARLQTSDNTVLETCKAEITELINVTSSVGFYLKTLNEEVARVLQVPGGSSPDDDNFYLPDKTILILAEHLRGNRLKIPTFL